MLPSRDCSALTVALKSAVRGTNISLSHLPGLKTHCDMKHVFVSKSHTFPRPRDVNGALLLSLASGDDTFNSPLEA